MQKINLSDKEFVEQHRAIWLQRPDLRTVYHQFFEQLTRAVASKTPVLELGAGPGFLKDYCPDFIASDVVSTPWVDLVCDGCSLPFRNGSIGAIVMVDVLHHLPRPVDFIAEAARVLIAGGRVVMIEPWITPASYLLYRYFHHEDCKLSIDIRAPFNTSGKDAFDGNATIPYKLVQHFSKRENSPLRLIELKRFLALPYLATLGFKRTQPMPQAVIRSAERCEKLLGAIGRANATRALLVWQN